MTEHSDKIREILTSIGYTLSDYGAEFRARPIYRDSDNNTVLRIKKSNGHWIDFKTNESGNLLELVRLSLNLESINEAKKYVNEEFPLSEVKTKIIRPKISQPRIFSKELLSKLRKDNRYWNARGISDDTLDLFNGGVCSSGRMANRYVFPIFDNRNKLCGVSGRYIYHIKSGYKIAKWKHIGDKYSWAYPSHINEEFIKSKKMVFLVESIGDMLSMWDAGIKNTLVVFGLNISSSILNVLLRFDPERIILSFNNDSNNNFAGNNAAKKAHKNLLKHFDTDQLKIVFPTKNDFGEMTRDEIRFWGEDNFGG